MILAGSVIGIVFYKALDPLTNTFLNFVEKATALAENYFQTKNFVGIVDSNELPNFTILPFQATLCKKLVEAAKLD